MLWVKRTVYQQERNPQTISMSSTNEQEEPDPVLVKGRLHQIRMLHQLLPTSTIMQNPKSPHPCPSSHSPTTFANVNLFQLVSDS